MICAFCFVVLDVSMSTDSYDESNCEIDWVPFLKKLLQCIQSDNCNCKVASISIKIKNVRANQLSICDCDKMVTYISQLLDNKNGLRKLQLHPSRLQQKYVNQLRSCGFIG